MGRPIRLWLNGRVLNSGKNAKPLWLTPLKVVWGSDVGENQPSPATMTVTAMFTDGTTMADLPELIRGTPIEVTDPEHDVIVFAGIVADMDAQPSTRKKGALEVTISAVDHLGTFENEYFSPDWTGGYNRVAQLRSAFNAAGWELRLPEDERESAPAVLDSVKLGTMLERYMSRFDGRRYDTSYRAEDGTLELHRRVSVFAASERMAPADQLEATFIGWFARLDPPMLEDGPAPIAVLESSNILADPSWTSGSEDVVTAVKFSTMAMGDNGRSELVEHNYRAPLEVRNRLGLRSIDRDSDLADPDDWQPAAAAYFTNDAPWKTSAITIKDPDLLDFETQKALLSPHTRYQTVVVVKNIMANRPDPGPSHLRAYVVGGEYEWDGERWQMTITLDRPILNLDGTGDWWTCQRVADSTDPLISDATCSTVGNDLTVADFRFIGEPT